jgi:hypothetical protein
MIYCFSAFVVEGGRPGKPILDKKSLQERLKTNPETIYVKAHPDNYFIEDPYEGLLSEAPHDFKLIIEGRKDAKTPSTEALMMGLFDPAAKEVTFRAYLEWSERGKRWRITM